MERGETAFQKQEDKQENKKKKKKTRRSGVEHMFETSATAKKIVNLCRQLWREKKESRSD